MTTPSVGPIRIVSYSCETLWPGHRAAHTLTFDHEQVTNTFGFEQHGVLTPAGTEELGQLLAAIDPAAIPHFFEGEAPPQGGYERLPDRFFQASCELRLDLGDSIGIYTWDEWPTDELVDLYRFVAEAIVPLAGCESTDAVDVVEPCVHVVVD